MTKQQKRQPTIKEEEKTEKFALAHPSTSLRLCLSALLFYLLALAACATLPRFEEVYQRLDVEKGETPKIIGLMVSSRLR